MGKPKVFATHELFDAARQILQQTCEVEYWTQSERPSREEFLRRVKDKEGVICLLTERINDEMLRIAPRLRIAANVGSGTTTSMYPPAHGAVWWPRTRRA